MVIAFAAGFLLLSGVFYVTDHLLPKQNKAAALGGQGEALSVRSVLKSLSPMLHDRCAASAKAALAQRGIDVSGGDAGKAIDSYCACAVDQTVDEMSIRDLLAFMLNRSSEPAASKMQNIMRKCQEGIGQ